MTGIFDSIPCTWRGIPIQVYGYTRTTIPQKKSHMGAFWTQPFIEDLGTEPIQIKISGFLDPDFDALERPLLEAMVLAPGAGLLTIPTQGVIYAHCMGATFTEDVSDLIEISIDFIQVQSPLGILGQLIGGSLPDGITSAITDVQSDVTGWLGQTVAQAPGAISGIFK